MGPTDQCLPESPELCAQLSNHLTGISVLVSHDSHFPGHPYPPGRNCVSIQLLRPRQHAGPACLHTRAVLTGCCMRMLLEPPDLRGPKGQAHTTSSPQLNYLLQGCRQDRAWLRSQLCLRLPFPHGSWQSSDPCGLLD